MYIDPFLHCLISPLLYLLVFSPLTFCTVVSFQEPVIKVSDKEEQKKTLGGGKAGSYANRRIAADRYNAQQQVPSELLHACLKGGEPAAAAYKAAVESNLKEIQRKRAAEKSDP